VGQVWREWGAVIVASVFGLPVAAAVVVVVATLRRRRGSFRPWSDSIAEVGMVAGTVPWLWMILTPEPARRSVDLVPGPALVQQLTGDPATAVVQIGGNLLVFAAFGAFAAVRFSRAKVWQLVLLAAAMSAVVEVAQYALDLGRVSSVNDTLLNALGAGVAGAAVRSPRVLARRTTSRRSARGFAVHDAVAN
jgi:VanZ like family